MLMQMQMQDSVYMLVLMLVGEEEEI